MPLTSPSLHSIRQAPKESWDVVAWISNVFSGFTKWVLVVGWQLAIGPALIVLRITKVNACVCVCVCLYVLVDVTTRKLLT